MLYSPDEQALIWLCACTDTDHRERAALLRAVKRPAQLFEQGELFFANVIKRRVNGLYKEGGCAFEAARFVAEPFAAEPFAEREESLALPFARE